MPSENSSGQLTPMAMSILGLEQAGFLPPSTRSPRASQEGTRRSRTAQHERRAASYYNHFSTKSQISNDSPPSYANSEREARFPVSRRHLDNGNEILPKYTCSVRKEGPMQMLLESCSPFTMLPCQEWREVYVVLEGTQLCIHKVKTSSVGSAKIFSAGKLLRKYTLQHAEVGLASDISFSMLVPMTRMAGLIPTIARRKAYERDRELFRVEKQYSLRVRSELDQFVLACPAEEVVFSWVSKICAGIDIALPIDIRSIPRQCTMPRRRRRTPRAFQATDMSNERFIQEQSRILQAMYPALAQETPAASNELTPINTTEPSVAAQDVPEMVTTPVIEQEQEDVDLSVIAEEAPERPASSADATPRRPAASRQTTTETVMTMSAMERVPTASINLDINGKWSPPHPQSIAQQVRYIRRCMPLLHADTPRHCSIMISRDKHVKPNYKLDVLEEWSLQPPSYDAHNFPEDAPATTTSRRPTISSTDGSQNGSAVVSGDEIMRADTPVQGMEAHLALEKFQSQKQGETITPVTTQKVSKAQRNAARQAEIEAGLAMLGF